LAALSDGLFAIVLTLLVLDIKISEISFTTTDADLVRQLIGIYPKIFSYVLTFMVAGFCWVSHHWDFQYMVGNARKLLWGNLMVLFSVGLLPFTTDLIGSHLSPLTWSIYALNVVFIGLGQTAIWGLAAASGMIIPGLPRKAVWFIGWKHLVAPGLFILSAVIAQVNVALATWTPILLPLSYALLAGIHPGGRILAQAGRRSRYNPLWQFASLIPLIGFLAWTVWAFVASR
jgi:uncharacterized membrane protein